MSDIADKIYAATGLTLNAEAAAAIGQMIQQAKRDALAEAARRVLYAPARRVEIMERYKMEIVNDHGDRYIRCEPATDGSWVMFKDVAALQDRIAALEAALATAREGEKE